MGMGIRNWRKRFEKRAVKTENKQTTVCCVEIWCNYRRLQAIPTLEFAITIITDVFIYFKFFHPQRIFAQQMFRTRRGHWCPNQQFWFGPTFINHPICQLIQLFSEEENRDKTLLIAISSNILLFARFCEIIPWLLELESKNPLIYTR